VTQDQQSRKTQTSQREGGRLGNRRGKRNPGERGPQADRSSRRSGRRIARFSYIVDGRNADKAAARIRGIRAVCSFKGRVSPRPADDHVFRRPTRGDTGAGQHATVEEPSAKPDNRGRRVTLGEAPARVRCHEARERAIVSELATRHRCEQRVHEGSACGSGYQLHVAAVLRSGDQRVVRCARPLLDEPGLVLQYNRPLRESGRCQRSDGQYTK